MHLKLLLKRGEPCRIDRCPNGLVDYIGQLALKTDKGLFYLRDGLADPSVLPEEIVFPVTYEIV